MRYSAIGLFALLAASFVFSACASTQVPDYEERLTKVKTGDVEVTPDDEDTLTYEDEFVRFTWDFPDEQMAVIGFRLENKTDSQIKILWNEASYVDPSGTTQEIFHQGMNSFEAETVMQPTVVPSKAKTETAILPRQHVRATAYGAEFAPLVARDTTEEKTVRVILPLKYKDKVARYDFHFGISRVTDEQEDSDGIKIKKADKKKTNKKQKKETSKEAAGDETSNEADGAEETDETEDMDKSEDTDQTEDADETEDSEEESPKD